MKILFAVFVFVMSFATTVQAAPQRQPKAARKVKPAPNRKAPVAVKPLGPFEGSLRVRLGKEETRDWWKDNSVVTDDRIVHGGWDEGTPQRSYLLIGSRSAKKFVRFDFLGKGANYRVPLEPQFSPDGRYVSFFFALFGEPRDYPDLYVLDTTNFRVRKVQSAVEDGAAKWSPDSRFIAVLDNWHSEDAKPSARFPTLFLCDVQTGKSEAVVCDDAVSGILGSGFDWGAPHTLYYSDFPASRDTLKQEKAVYIHPDLYALDAKQSKPKLVARDAYRPRLSPDGTWIAFFGSEDLKQPYPMRENWTQHANNVSFSVMKSDGTARKALNREIGSYPELGWTPDNKTVFTIKESYEPKPKLGSTKGELEAISKGLVKRWDVATGGWKKVTGLEAHHYEFEENYATGRTPFKVFRIVDVKSSESLLYGMREQIGVEHYSILKYRLSYAAVQTGTGANLPIVEIENTFSYSSSWLAQVIPKRAN